MRRILIVEDSAATRALVRATLEEPVFAEALRQPGDSAIAGPPEVEVVEVTEATCGFDAMRILPRQRFDLLITDLNMVDINGLELIHFVRRSEHHRTTPLVIISTQAAQRDVDRGLALGANAYVKKPFKPDELRAVCADLLLKSASGSGEGAT